VRDALSTKNISITHDNPLLGASRIHANSSSLVLMSRSRRMGHLEAHAV